MRITQPTKRPLDRSGILAIILVYAMFSGGWILVSDQVLRGEAAPGSPLEGVDYRGIPVVGVARGILGIDGFLLTQLDQSELYNNAAGDTAWIGLVGALILFMTGACFYLLRQNQQLTLAQAVQQSQAERLHALNLLAAIADGSDDAIFAKDMEGRYTLFNRAADHYVGKLPVDVLNHDDRSLFPAEQAEMLMAFDRQVITGNRTYNQEEVLDTPIHREHGNTRHSCLY